MFLLMMLQKCLSHFQPVWTAQWAKSGERFHCFRQLRDSHALEDGGVSACFCPAYYPMEFRGKYVLGEHIVDCRSDAVCVYPVGFGRNVESKMHARSLPVLHGCDLVEYVHDYFCQGIRSISSIRRGVAGVLEWVRSYQRISKIGSRMFPVAGVIYA